MAVALAPMAATADGCRKLGDGSITCPRLVLERWKAETLDLEERLAEQGEELARARAGLARCDGEVTLLEAALASRPQEPPTPAWRPLVTLPILTLAAGGGACLAGDGCPLAAGWMGIALAVGAAIVGGLW